MASQQDPLTYEEVTEIFRREKSSKALTEVRRDLYSSIRDCQEKLKRDSEREFGVDPLSPKSKSLASQMTKLQEKVAQVFEFRMEKLLQMALRSAVGNKVDVSKLTIEEKEIYDNIFMLLKERRLNMVEGQRYRQTADVEESAQIRVKSALVEEAEAENEVFDAPGPSPLEAEAMVKQAQPARPPAEAPLPLVPSQKVDGANKDGSVKAPAVVQVPASSSGPLPSDYIVLRIIEDIPTFAAPGKNYRLQKEDMVTLPPAIAKALVIRKKAVGVQLFPESIRMV